MVEANFRGFPICSSEKNCASSSISYELGLCKSGSYFQKNVPEAGLRVGRSRTVRAHNLCVDEETHRIILAYWLPNPDGSYPAERLSEQMGKFYTGMPQESCRGKRYRFRSDARVAVDRGASSDPRYRWARGIFAGCATEGYIVKLVDYEMEGIFAEDKVFSLDRRFLKDPIVLSRACVTELDDTDLVGEIRQHLVDILTCRTNHIKIRYLELDPIVVDVFINFHALGLFVWREQRLLTGYLVPDGFRIDVGTVVYAPNGREVHVVAHDNFQWLLNVHSVVEAELKRCRSPDLSVDAMNAVTFSDGLQYRAMTTEINGRKYSVRLVDYGNRFEADPRDMYGLSPAAQCMESPVVCCQLADIPEEKLDDKAVVDWLAALLKSGEQGEKRCVYEITGSTKDGQLPTTRKIRLWKDNGEDSSAIPVSSVERSSDDSGVWSLFGEQSGDKFRLQRGYQVRFDDLNKGEEYDIGDVIAVRPSSFLDPENVALYPASGYLVQLYHQMAEEIRVVTESLPGLDDLPPDGIVICARYTGDEKWYRAFVIERQTRTTAWIAFVDYGNIELAELSNMKPLTESLSRYPKMCFPARINGIEPPFRGGYTAEHTRTAKDALMDKLCSFRILSSDQEVLTGDLFLETETNVASRNSVADLFVSMGIAAMRA